MTRARTHASIIIVRNKLVDVRDENNVATAEHWRKYFEDFHKPTGDDSSGYFYQ